MQVPTAKLLRLLQPDHPLEVRSAAAIVLGELGVKDGEVAEALCACLEVPEQQVRLPAIRAIGKLHIEKALPQLLARVQEGGEDAQEAARAAAHVSAKGARSLQELMPKVAPGLRRYIAAALAGVGDARTAESATVAVLLDKDPGVVEAAVRSLMEQVPNLGRGQRDALVKNLIATLKDKMASLSPASQAAVVRVLAALNDPAAADVLWERLLPPHPPEVRAAALQAVGPWAESPDKDQLQRLFRCAGDRDFRIAAPALMLLRRLPITARNVRDWLALLDAPDVAVRQAALEAVGDRDSPEVAEALLRQLRHPDRALRDNALGRLTKMKHGQEALTTALLEADTADAAWNLARALAPHAKAYPPRWRERVFERIGPLLEAGDRQAEPLLFLLRESDPADLRDRLEARALHWRKKQDYAKALLYLRVVARDPACGFATRLEQAACGLKVSSHDLAEESRAGDPCLHQFTHLCNADDGELYNQLEKMNWLTPEDLYYLGFHFTELDGRLRKFGERVLQLVVKRSPRSKTGQAAKSKLRMRLQ
jgi:HEAT repeat protein